MNLKFDIPVLGRDSLQTKPKLNNLWGVSPVKPNELR